jgi:ribosomal protein S10
MYSGQNVEVAINGRQNLARYCGQEWTVDTVHSMALSQHSHERYEIHYHARFIKQFKSFQTAVAWVMTA